MNEDINHFSEQNKLDMILTIPKKHNLLQRVFSRSNKKELIYHTYLPVLCMHE